MAEGGDLGRGIAYVINGGHCEEEMNIGVLRTAMYEDANCARRKNEKWSNWWRGGGGNKNYG